MYNAPMPKRAPRICSFPGCPNTGAGWYCAEHGRVNKGGTPRPSPDKQGYDWLWKKRRLRILARDPLCHDPYKRHRGRVVPATQVDHILPKRHGGTDAEENLQSLCAPCHSYKTRLEQLAKGRGGESLGPARPLTRGPSTSAGDTTGGVGG